MTPKCSPKWSKNMTKNLMEVGTNFGWILEPFWPHFGRLGGPMGSIFGAKIERCWKILTKIGPKSSQKRLFWPPGGPKACQSAPKVPKGPHFWGFWYPQGTFSIKIEPMITYFCHQKRCHETRRKHRKFEMSQGVEIFWILCFEISKFSKHWPYLPEMFSLEGRRQWR